MSIPDAAIEAAAEALVGFFGRSRSWAEIDAASTAIEAAMPAIREAIAQEIEAIPYSPELEHGDNGEWMQAEAARTARGAK